MPGLFRDEGKAIDMALPDDARSPRANAAKPAEAAETSGAEEDDGAWITEKLNEIYGDGPGKIVAKVDDDLMAMQIEALPKEDRW